MKEIHLWNLETLALVKKYEGQKQGRFVIRSCFGGPDEDFVISGSEDYNVYVWHREKGKIIDRLPGHGGIVISNRMC
jgi:WD40 repeat protein